MTDPIAARRTVYLDHAATSWPKPPEVIEAVVRTMVEAGANPGRGAYEMALAASRVVFEARADCARLLGVADPRDLLFLSGATEACNLMLKGLLRPGDRVVVSSMEHNAVVRPRHVLEQAGVTVDVVTADAAGVVDADMVERAVAAAPTRAVVCIHASNVTGAVQPLPDIADIAHTAGALLLVDGAQGAGHLEVDIAALDVDAYATSGHKGLLGPQGVGLLYLRPGLDVVPLKEGGTGGGSSGEATQPEGRPERYEAGTPNTPGIAGAGAGARLLVQRGAEIRAEERRLARRLREELPALPGLRLYGPAPDEPAVPVMVFTLEGHESERVAFQLDRTARIAVRPGLHCAPWAHRTIGTAETGAVRVSVGHGNTDEDVDALLAALRKLLA
jgi:cysteine desulfurase family protein